MWASDITYIPMARGFVYLAAVMDWFARRILAWRLSITLEVNKRTLCRHHPRWEPYALIGPVRICAGGAGVTCVPTAIHGSGSTAREPSRDIAGDYGWRRVGKAAEAFRRWHGVYSALPTRLALGPIGGPTLA